MGLMMLVGVAFIVALVYLLYKGASSHETRGIHSEPTHKDTPLEIAQRRYAAGEITQDEFERIRKDLGG